MTDAVAGGGGAFNIRIYGYGLQHNMDQLQYYIAADETPVYQTIMAWIFAALIAIGSLLSIWLKGKKGSLLLAGAGLAYLAYTLVSMFIVISGRLKQYNIAIKGMSSSGMFRQLNIVFDSSIGTGFCLALVASVLLLILALFRFLVTSNGNAADQ